MRGLYIHIPFCVRKCAYCDFYSVPDRLDAIDAYIDAVLREARAHTGLSFQTLYLGGGTPSLLGAEGLSRLVASLRHCFDMSDLVEATIEVNPESAGVDLRRAARGVGINRVSVGVQSLADAELLRVGRLHSAADAIRAVVSARNSGFDSVSADVIVGLPGQTWETLLATLQELANRAVDHLSLYCLSLEHDTPLAMSVPDDLPSDDAQAELFEQAAVFLEGYGFNHYEISNFALPGFECRHNLNYWRGGEYLGLGPGAASHLGGRRFRNRADLEAYILDPTGLGEEVEQLKAEEKAAEEAMLRLRLLDEGLQVDELIGRFGLANTQQLVARLDMMVEEGLLSYDNRRYRLEPSRVLTSNPIFARVLRDD